MIRFIRKGALTAALIGFGFAPALSLAGPFAPKTAKTAPAKTEPVRTEPAKTEPSKSEAAPDDQVVIVREPGKPDRECTLVTVKENKDGSKTYTVKAKDNGQLLQIHQDAPVQQAGLLRNRNTPTTPQRQSAPPATATAEPPLSTTGEPPALDPAAINPAQPPVTAPRFTEPQPSQPVPVQSVPAPNKAPRNAKPESEKNPKGGLLRRLLSMEEGDPNSNCPECAAAQAQMATMQEVVPVAGTGKGVATIGTVPDSPKGKATIDMSVPNPLPIGQMPAVGNAMPQYMDAETAYFLTLTRELANGELPSRRMAAAEAMLPLAPVKMTEVREALMKAAQDDPAGCVRATAVQCLSKLRTNGDAFTALLDVAQHDEDEAVREAAKYAGEKLKK